MIVHRNSREAINAWVDLVTENVKDPVLQAHLRSRGKLNALGGGLRGDISEMWKKHTPNFNELVETGQLTDLYL